MATEHFAILPPGRRHFQPSGQNAAGPPNRPKRQLKTRPGANRRSQGREGAHSRAPKRAWPKYSTKMAPTTEPNDLNKRKNTPPCLPQVLRDMFDNDSNGLNVPRRGSTSLGPEQAHRLAMKLVKRFPLLTEGILRFVVSRRSSHLH